VSLTLPRLSRWGWWLLGVALLGLTVRLGYVFIYQYHPFIGGDSYTYHYGANLLADGKGFIAPLDYKEHGLVIQAADHAPLYTLILAAESSIGLSSYTDHQVLSCLIGTVTILLVGQTARGLFGKGAGIFAAVIVAIYPYFWFNDGTVLSEGLAQCATALAVLLAYRFWRRRDLPTAIWLGVAIALAALSRAEALLLPVLLVIPLVLWMRGMAWKRRISLILASGIATLVVIAPWVGYNFSRFERPVIISSELDITLLAANCDEAYYGPLRGFWSYKCQTSVPRTYLDPSRQAVEYRKVALDYARDHLSALPAVLLAREGRTWGWYRPSQMVQLDSALLTTPKNWGRFAMVMLYSLQVASIFGVLVMRKRRIPLTPLFALLVNAALATALTLGQTRLRSTSEIAFVLMATAGFTGLAGYISERRGRRLEQHGRMPEEQGARIQVDHT
jgi:4-amino-4-deoxy-L-arabinose transferase-like glycosyltransferase